MTLAGAQRPAPPVTAQRDSALMMWREGRAIPGGSTAEDAGRLADRLLSAGEPLLAYDILRAAANEHPRAVRLRQMLALALLRTGALETADQILSELRSFGHRDEETLGLAARVSKELFLLEPDPQRKDELLRSARQLYSLSYQTTGGYWSGINAATLSKISGDVAAARALAVEVIALCRNALAKMDAAAPERFWALATMGEASLLLEDWAAARELYREAAAIGAERFADINSARRNVRLLADYAYVDWRMFSPLLRVPRVTVLTGHMIDLPGRSTPRFPPGLETAVKVEIAAWIATHNVGFGYASGASGADLLFHECLLETGKHACVVLPYGPAEFRADSVDPAGWGERFERVLRGAERLAIAAEQKLLGPGAASFHYGNQMLAGMARLRAQLLDTDLLALAVWDGEENGAIGGTSETVREWRSRGIVVEVLDISKLRREVSLVEVGSASVSVAETVVTGSPAGLAAFAPVVRGILFADAVGFSRLRDDQLPIFVDRFLGSVARLLARTKHPPEVKNTWGDGLYFIFETVSDAGAFALELSDLVHGIHFNKFGLPPDLDLRIGLHAGPVYACIDPVLKQPNYVGTHVSRAARIEPITPPGHVYASEAFAALAAAEDASSLFHCEYVGQTPQAKGYGTYPTYVLRHARARASARH